MIEAILVWLNEPSSPTCKLKKVNGEWYIIRYTPTLPRWKFHHASIVEYRILKSHITEYRLL